MERSVTNVRGVISECNVICVKCEQCAECEQRAKCEQRMKYEQRVDCEQFVECGQRVECEQRVECVECEQHVWQFGWLQGVHLNQIESNKPNQMLGK